MRLRVPIARLAIALPLGGCTEHIDAAEAFVIGLAGLAALFVLLLFALPPLFDRLERRAHRKRMVSRRPWSADNPRPRRRRRKDA